MEGVGRKDFEVLYWIEFMGFNTPALLSQKMSNLSEEKIHAQMQKLEREGLITAEWKGGKIVSSRLTDEGQLVLDNEKYNDWREDLGSD